MKSLCTVLAAAVLATPHSVIACSVTQAAPPVDPSRITVDSKGEEVFLTAGTYQLSVTGGGWEFTTQTSCSRSAKESWSEAFDMSIGSGATADYSLKDNPTFDTESSALSAYTNAILYRNGAAAGVKNDISTFTIARGGQDVYFELPTAAQCGLRGGVDVSITPNPASGAAVAPEPSTVGLMGAILVGGALLLRRRRQAKSH